MGRTAALRLPAVDVRVHRSGMQLQGTVATGAVAATWRGQLTHTSLLLDMDLPPNPVRDGYALFSDAIPELATAQIDGTFALRASFACTSTKRREVQPYAARKRQPTPTSLSAPTSSAATKPYGWQPCCTTPPWKRAAGLLPVASTRRARSG